jgi:hypothetical protein
MIIAQDDAINMAILNGTFNEKQLNIRIKATEKLTKAEKEFQKIQLIQLQDKTMRNAMTGDSMMEYFNLMVKANDAAYVKQQTEIDLIEQKNGYLLEQISYEETKVNKIYDKQIEKLDAMYKKQEDINQSQRERFDIIQQIATGDMAGAARAIQDARQREALAQIEKKREDVEKQRKKQLEKITAGGKTRKQIEDEDAANAKKRNDLNIQAFDNLMKIREFITQLTNKTPEQLEAYSELAKAAKALGLNMNNIKIESAINGAVNGIQTGFLNILEKKASTLFDAILGTDKTSKDDAGTQKKEKEQLPTGGNKDTETHTHPHPENKELEEDRATAKQQDVADVKRIIEEKNNENLKPPIPPGAKRAQEAGLFGNLTTTPGATGAGANKADAGTKKSTPKKSTVILGNAYGEPKSSTTPGAMGSRSGPTLQQIRAAENAASDAREAQIKDKASLTIAGVAQTLGAMGSRGAAGISSPTLQQVIAAANKAARLPDSAKAKQQDVADVARIVAQKEAYQNIKIGKGKNEQKITVPKNFGMSSGGLVPKYMSKGGMTKPLYRPMGGLIPYFLGGGFAKGTDTVPAMLTPGEFVVQKRAVDKLGIGIMNRINQGELPANNNSAVYNYNLSVNVSNTNANPNDIARVVINQIKQIDSQRIRSSR